MKKLLPAFFIIIAFFLYTHLCVLYGSLRERDGAICISPEQMRTLNKTLETTKAVCVDMVQGRVADLNDQVKEKKQEAASWQKKYAEAVASSTASCPQLQEISTELSPATI